MKVLLVHRLCQMGGLQTWMLSLAQSLRISGHQCELFFFTHGNFESLIPNEQPTHFGGLAELMLLVQQQKTDIVHCAASDWELGVSAVRRLGAKLVLTGHGEVHPCLYSTNSDALVGCSQWEGEAQGATSDLPVEIVFNGIDTIKFHPPTDFDSESPIVAWVGRGADLRQKRIDKFAEIALELHRRKFRLWIADPDGPDKVLPAAAARLKPLSEFWGGVPCEEMPQWYRTIAASGGCVLSTSSFEGLSMALLEAQACGCPVVGPDRIGVVEGVRTEHGGVIYPFDAAPSDVADLVTRMLGNREEMAWRRQACRKFVEDGFSIVRMNSEYVSVYKNAPFPRRRGVYSLLKRLRSLPFVNPRLYKKHRWAAGHHQYQASQRLNELGQPELAASALLESLATSITLFCRRERMTALLAAVKDHGIRPLSRA